MRIDSHQHFWKFDPVRDSWITDAMALIRRDFLPEDLWAELKQNNMDGCVAVQASQSEEETDFLLELTRNNNWIKGIVGWVDLRNSNIKERLEYYSHFKKIKGFRHILQGETPDFMLQHSFLTGISLLSLFNFTYDILVYPIHLKSVAKLVSRFPNQLFVIDHLAKPYIRDGLIEDWKKDMKVISGFDNIFCKISGLVTEAKPKKWKNEDFKPYLDAAVELFGTGRIMFGSDWPPCLLEADYKTCLSLAEEYFSPFSALEKEKIFGLNAAAFYNIDVEN